MAKTKEVTRRIKIARGQLEGILKMIDEERDMIEISTQLLAAIKLLKVANKKVIEIYLNEFIEYKMNNKKNEDSVEEKIEELMNLITRS